MDQKQMVDVATFLKVIKMLMDVQLNARAEIEVLKQTLHAANLLQPDEFAEAVRLKREAMLSAFQTDDRSPADRLLELLQSFEGRVQ